MSPTITNICQHQRILKITPFNGTNSTSKYCNKRWKKLKACIKGVSSDMQQIFLHRYNARSHMSARKHVNIDCFDFTVLGHPQYNPKLGSSLPRHEGHLAGHHTLPNNEVKTVIIPWNYMNVVRTLWITDVNFFRSLENWMFLLCSLNTFFHYYVLLSWTGINTS